ncbi:MAG: permease [Rhizobiales bacterium]|nr:permease [Hyphomicrobiales bacterium]
MMMTDITAPTRPSPLLDLLNKQRVWLSSAVIVTGIALVSPQQALDSLGFVAGALLHTAPFLMASILIAAWAGATGADNLIARAFTGSPLLMVVLAALAGGLSPFCSCGVIPLIAALLAMGIPLSAVMAFWLASPVMDPSMFVLTSGVLGAGFAIAKTLSAIGLGIIGGVFVWVLSRSGALADPLKEGIGNGGCGGSNIRSPKPVVWQFWNDTERRAKFGREAIKTMLFLAKWLVLAFLLESLMLAFVPAETITAILGGTGIGPIALATVVGVPAYLNGYAALPLVAGLIAQGMAPGAGLSFLVAGGVTSLPAAIAVWALVKPRVFFLYIALSLSGALLCGLLYQAWVLA